jgi:hypothetical protein
MHNVCVYIYIYIHTYTYVDINFYSSARTVGVDHRAELKWSVLVDLQHGM